jgi:hypothetical protein
VGVNATLLRGDDIMLCDTCGRYLIMGAEDKAAAAATVAEEAKGPKPVKTTAGRKKRKSAAGSSDAPISA